MPAANVVAWIRAKFSPLRDDLDERARRRWAAVEALSLGRGGVSAVAVATGMSRDTIRRGARELEASDKTASLRRIRRPGGGRKPLTTKQPELLSELEALVDATTRGDPQSALRWTCKSTRQLASELAANQRTVSPMTVSRLLRQAGFSLQGNRKTQEGKSHPDRNLQFEHINTQTKSFQRRGQPVISVDTKKKELIGNFKNGGKEWRPKGKPLDVQVHDFPDPELGKAIGCGLYGARVFRAYSWFRPEGFDEFDQFRLQC